jgi:hypothetical protein
MLFLILLTLLITLVSSISPKIKKAHIESCINRRDCQKYGMDYYSVMCIDNICECNYGFEKINGKCLCTNTRKLGWNNTIIGNDCLNNTECNYRWDCNYDHAKCVGSTSNSRGKCVCNYGFEDDDCLCPKHKDILWNDKIKEHICLNRTECIHDHHCKYVKYSKCFNSTDTNIGKCVCNYGFDSESDGECLCSYNKILTYVNNQHMCLGSEECDKIGWYCTYGRLYVLLQKYYDLLLSIILVKLIIVLIVCAIYKIDVKK